MRWDSGTRQAIVGWDTGCIHFTFYILHRRWVGHWLAHLTFSILHRKGWDGGCRCFIFNLSLIILVGAKIVGKFSENNHIYSRRNRRFVVGEFGEFYIVGHWVACILIRSGTVGTVGLGLFLYLYAHSYTLIVGVNFKFSQLMSESRTFSSELFPTAKLQNLKAIHNCNAIANTFYPGCFQPQNYKI